MRGSRETIEKVMVNLTSFSMTGFSGGSVTVRGGISIEGKTDLYRLDNGTLTAVTHRDEILGATFRPFASAVGPGSLPVHDIALRIQAAPGG